MRKFKGGAVRDIERGKIDYEGCFSPLVFHLFGEFMHKHNLRVDGKLRRCDDWQKGIPKESYVKSLWRHFLDFWSLYRGMAVYKERTDNGELTHILSVPKKPVPKGWEEQTIEDAGSAIIFNIQGFLHEHLKEKAGK